MSEPAAVPAPPVRDAATVVLVRRDGPEPRLLMGQRGAGAAFMPSKFVFPGGAVDSEDAAVARDAGLGAGLLARLSAEADPAVAAALPFAAIRELWEETGLALARAGEGPPAGAIGPSWSGFFAAGHRPAADRLDFIFRAITPPGRPRRFDARFFLAAATDLSCDPDDFAGACGELSHLSWVSLAEARRLDLPFVTEIVLGEVAARLDEPDAPRAAPFFRHGAGRSWLAPL